MTRAVVLFRTSTLRARRQGLRARPPRATASEADPWRRAARRGRRARGLSAPSFASPSLADLPSCPPTPASSAPGRRSARRPRARRVGARARPSPGSGRDGGGERQATGETRGLLRPGGRPPRFGAARATKSSARAASARQPAEAARIHPEATRCRPRTRYAPGRNARRGRTAHAPPPSAARGARAAPRSREAAPDEVRSPGVARRGSSETRRSTFRFWSGCVPAFTVSTSARTRARAAGSRGGRIRDELLGSSQMATDSTKGTPSTSRQGT